MFGLPGGQLYINTNDCFFDKIKGFKDIPIES